MESLFSIHLLFDLAAAFCAVAGGAVAYLWRFRDDVVRTAAMIGGGYFLLLAFGSLAGAYGLGTLNLYFSGVPAVGRSILGALAGATLSVELYKWKKGIVPSTGYIYVVPFCLAVIVGRFGCFFAGLEDHTYGVVTELPWGTDFGDHVLRHPVQLYESFSMAFFLLLFVLLMKFHVAAASAYGYYLCVGFYALQRFLWEFLKPYADVAGIFNLFQVVCIGLVLYSIAMIFRVRYARRYS